MIAESTFGTGKNELGKASDVLLDKTVEFGYTDHALWPDPKEAGKL